VERLDDRVLPSASSGVAAPAAAARLAAVVANPTHPHHVTLVGQVSGTWANVLTLPDVRRPVDLSGAGTLSPLGTVQASGTLYTPGFIRQGRSTGTLVLSNAQGSLTIQLTGPLQPGFSPPPGTFSYRITGGTGAYAGDTGQGTASFHENTSDPGAGTFTLSFGPVVPPPLLGQISGTWTRVPVVPDLGQHQKMNGSGPVGSLGTVRVSGQLGTPGFILQGRSTGTLVLSNAQGSLTIQLTGPLQTGFSPPPHAFFYQIAGGTGAYAGDTGQGTASFHETTSGTGGGTFTLTFDPAPGAGSKVAR
jgi:hypothetical protein